MRSSFRGRHTLATVSVIALATAGYSGSVWASDQYNATINWSTEVATVAGSSSSVVVNNSQNNSNVDVTPPVTTVQVGVPTTGMQDYNGLDAIIVDDNTIFSSATLTTVPMANSIEFWTATGSGASSAATIASLQSSENGSSMIASVANSEIRASSSDLFAGSAQQVTDNAITSDAMGNLATNVISGDINPLLTSTEGGFAGISGGPTLGNPATGTALGASATALVASVQENTLAASSSTIDNTRIGSLAVELDTTSTIQGIPLVVTGNAIEATITGNDATNQVNLDDSLDAANTSAVTLQGSAGVASAQRNTVAGRTYLVQVSESDIEAGLSAATPISNLTGSSIDFSDNNISATGTGNTADNLVRLGDGISQSGTFPFGAIGLTRSSTVLVAGSGSDGNVNVIGDLFIANHQFSELEINAIAGGIAGDSEDADMNVLVESVASSTVEATGNAIGASVTGNNATNTILVEGAATFDSLVSLGSGQVLTNGSSGSATTNGDVTVSVATLGTVTGDIADSAVGADDNRLYGEAFGNVGRNSVSIDGTTIIGAEVNPQFNFVQSAHATIEPRVAADFGVVSGQFNRETEYNAQVIGSVIVDAADVSGADGSSITNSTIGASGNSAAALSVANRVTQNSFTIGGDGPTSSFSGTVGVINFQLAEGSDATATDHLTMTAAVGPTDDAATVAIIDVDATALAVDQANIGADANAISARVVGNLADAQANRIDISAVTVGDGVPTPTDQLATPVATVYRSLTDAVIPNAAPDGLPDTVVQGGFVLVNDQSIEDISADALGDVPLSATVSGNLVEVRVGSTAATATVTQTDVSASGNAVTGAVTGNQGSNLLSVGAVTLDATSTLVNTQTFWNEDGGTSGFSGSIEVDVSGGILTSVAAGAATITEVNAETNGNTVLASGRINNAASTVSVTAQTQTVVDVVTGSDVNAIEMGYATVGTVTAGNTLMRAETGLLNSQEFGGLRATGLSVDLTGVVVSTTMDAVGGALADSVVQTNGNSLSALSLGNDAANSLTLDVGTFDLTDAGSATATNGPLAIIANHQRGSEDDGGTGPISATADAIAVVSSVSGIDTSVSGSQVSADGNSVRTLARVNNATNVLSVTGTTYEELVTAAPSIEVLDVAANVELTVEDLAFGIGSYQLNALDVDSFINAASVYADASDVAFISSSALSASGNLLVSEARGNDVANAATIDFTTNNVSGFVANLQQTDDGGASIISQVLSSTIAVEAELDPQVLTDSSFAADGNAMAAIATANRATNSATATGTNLSSGTGTVSPTATINPAVASDVTVVADLAVVNVQGAEAVASTQNDTLLIIVDSNSVLVDLNQFVSGSATVDNNLVLGQATIHSATNTATLDADANIAGASASVISQQIVTSGSSATVALTAAFIQATSDTMSDAGSASISASGNQLSSLATGGTASNRLNGLADAAITGASPAAAPVFAGSAYTVNADFSVLNVQLGETDISTLVGPTGVSADVGTDATTPLVNDTVDVRDNIVQAGSTGFASTNSLVLDAGSSSDATGQVANRQAIVVGAVLTSTAASNFVRSQIVGGALDSSVTVDDNSVAAQTTGNTALNALRTTADASLQESSAAGATIDPASGITVTGADYAVLNSQSTTAALSSQVIAASIGVDGLAGTQGVDTSAVTVNGNQVVAETTANNALNSLVLSTGTFQHPSASVSNLQVTSDSAVSASTDDVSVGIGLGGGLINGPSSGSSFTVRGNTVGASAIGNAAVSAISGD
ncbi:hypothetical protein [Iodidimonas sp. SYSU 1G8]|uniref:beta strand repeat-containing protein n=1 Tax=Iodidimonas sp. SYSU 1G8 TaxID=3133967 RepID=UPI0031FF1FDE